MLTRGYAALAALLLVIACPVIGGASPGESPIPPGTVITMKNWRQYKQYMPHGMELLFSGTYFWKMPADFRMEIGPTSHYPISQAYRENTKKYSHLVQLVGTSSGGHALKGYVAGLPFPNPADPLKGFKILANMWYRPMPYLFCGNSDREYLVNSAGQISGFRVEQVFRRLDHISRPGGPITDPQAEGVEFSEFAMFTEPEQYKYTQILTLFYDNPEHSEDDYVYVPQLRRVVRQSPNQRCAPMTNGDFTPDDLEGFNGGIARFQADYLHDQQILALVNSDPKLYGKLANYYSILFPKPVVGKWEVRDSYVLDARRIASKRAGYCYGKQILYIDKYSYNLSWKDLYNPAMKLIKIQSSQKLAGEIPGEGTQFNTGNSIETMWDITKNHMSFFATAGPDGKALVANQACRNVDGVNYDDVKRYGSVGGLSQVMR
ncbi:MAG TPA: DUF1329 domain-containing protein [Candidatus Binataceae bacterium]|nr:DUF1329 domain-containing protein [Candidatus Binataceae bacterium]